MMLKGIVAVLVCFLPGYAFQEEFCFDHKGKIVQHGERYFPLGSDPCTQCTCSNGKSEMCISVFCSPPENCRQYHTLNDKCCEFVCLDANYPHMPSGNGTITNDDSLNATNLGLRLVASAFTSFLILALLLFMIHRLRQRRLLLVIRRLNGRLDTQGSNGGHQYSIDDETSVGYFVGRDHLDFGSYDEPPPPYSFWKPPSTYIPTGEAPPPYESTEQVPNGIQPQSGGDATRSRKEESLCQHDSTNAPVQIQRSSSHSSPSEMESEASTNASNARESTCIVLSEDIEENASSCHPSENVTVLHVKGPGSSGSFRLCEDDIVNGNMLPNRENATSNRREREFVGKRRVRCSANDRCHSYNEVLEEWRQRCYDAKAFPQQRHSVQPVIGRQNNNYFTDPTAWSGEASESSSSSSPGSDQQTGSLSSSDSSSVDCLHATSIPIGLIDKPVSKPQKPAPVVVPVLSGPVKKSVQGILAKSKVKGSSLDRTFQHIKKLSLARRKKSKDIDDVVRPKSEISSSKSCLPDNRKSRKTFSKSQSELVAGPSKYLEPTLQEDGLHHGRKIVVRPSNLNLSVVNQLLPTCQSSPASENSSTHLHSTSDSSDTGAPLPPTVVAIRCSSAARVNHINTRFSDSVLLDNLDRPNVQYVADDGFVLSRSGSICSETGERRIRLSSVGEMLSNENHPLEREHSGIRTSESCEAVIHSTDRSPQRTLHSAAKNINDRRFSFLRDDTRC